MSYKVIVEYDGCPNWEIALPDAQGTMQEVLSFISKHLPPKGCEFSIVDLASGRCMSYMMPEPVARRYRLQMQDLRLRK